MADKSVVHIGENSPEEVAYKLYQEVARCEAASSNPHSQGNRTATRKWILSTYAQCLKTVRDGAMPKDAGANADWF